MLLLFVVFFFFKQKTAYEMRISDRSSDVCSSDLAPARDDVQQRIITQPVVQTNGPAGLFSLVADDTYAVGCDAQVSYSLAILEGCKLIIGELAAAGGGLVPTVASADIRLQAIGEVDAKLSENGKVSIVIMGRDIGRGRCRWLKSLKRSEEHTSELQSLMS